MKKTIRSLAAVIALSAFALPTAQALVPAAVQFTTPSEIKWVRNAAGTNETAVLFGDPSKPGPYVMRLRWLPGNMSRPGPAASTPAERK